MRKETGNMLPVFNFKIFVVDNNTYTFAMTHQHLVNLGYTDIRGFVSPDECLREMSDKPFVIFLDHQQEEKGGFTFLRKIKELIPDSYIVVFLREPRRNPSLESLKYGVFFHHQG